MLKPRIIPILLIHNGGLVKTKRFKSPKYIGDPLNTVRIFNDKQVDELIICDIDSTVKGKDPNYDLITNLAAECRMPICYSGGLKNLEQIDRIISLGVEKVALGSSASLSPELISKASSQVGSQSIVAVLDIKKTGLRRNYEVFINNGKIKTGKNPFDLAKSFESLGAGEILVNSIDNDGMMNGYDLELISMIRDVVNIPISVSGGAGCLDDIKSLINKFKLIGACAGSIFVFKGKYKAVLIQYPNPLQRSYLFSENQSFYKGSNS